MNFKSILCLSDAITPYKIAFPFSSLRNHWVSGILPSVYTSWSIGRFHPPSLQSPSTFCWSNTMLSSMESYVSLNYKNILAKGIACISYKKITILKLKIRLHTKNIYLSLDQDIIRDRHETFVAANIFHTKLELTIIFEKKYSCNSNLI